MVMLIISVHEIYETVKKHNLIINFYSTPHFGTIFPFTSAGKMYGQNMMKTWMF